MPNEKSKPQEERPSTPELFEMIPELNEFSQCCNEYLEARQLLDVRNLGFFEKVAVVTSLMKLDLRKSQIEAGRKSAPKNK